MPKSTQSQSSASRHSLRRNQACLTCRKRKLRCDAARPHCATCVKQWHTQISVPPPPGYAHPTEPQCSYDPVEGLPLAADADPLEKIRELEEQVAALTRKLRSQRGSMSPSRSQSPNHLRPPSSHLINRSPSSGTITLSPEFEPSGVATPTPWVETPLDRNAVPPSKTATQMGSPGMVSPQPVHHSDPLSSLIHSGWNTDLPEPAVLDHYIDVFFKCDPCGSRVFHRPDFLTSMRLPPKSPGFPHCAILHAICALASRWVSKNIITLPDGTRRDRFAEFHASKTRSYIDRTMASGEDIFAVMQACVLLSWYFYSEGRWVEIWVFAGFQTRTAIPLRLNYPGTYARHSVGSPGAYLAPPKDPLDLELRRRTWWMAVLFDRIVSVGGWVHGIDERDIGTELPLRSQDFETNQRIADNPQSLFTPDVFTTHPKDYTDSFLLLIKAMMLFGRVTDFSVRTNLRASAPLSRIQNPFITHGFEELDRLVSTEFIASLPPRFRNGLSEVESMYGGGGLDTDLYLVHLVPHAATITLHNPYIDFSDRQSVSTMRCIDASRAILAQHYTLASSSFDITRLHPFVTICWYLAAVVQIQLCKYFIETGDTDREYGVWGVINVLRFAMTDYGKRSPIGTRQEKLLQGLMSEIVRMTTQQQPLEVGIPLYPFSHAGVFSNVPGSDEDVGHVAPLPLSPSFEDAIEQPHGSPAHSNTSPPTTAWISR
ncbi:hypothetical protein DFH94DRAFT_441748 [Russula ochroleuca]|uniref:Zn(2)-C6 fungal-type domain-containing protein n=1 Tax=Russula ochroleuca TaxID=152965 RepID=A0A9P5MXG1_9AGAM|nr:hypothetical protein DFH94DRAFT_441748 [Russula ochroleuca]